MSKRMTEPKTVSILKEADAGMPAKELCRKYRIASSTFYKRILSHRDLTTIHSKR